MQISAEALGALHIDPGTLVRYVDNGNPTIGVVKGVSVNVSLPSVRQTIEVQTHG